MKKITVILSLVFASLHTLAANPGKFELNCKPAQPCLYAKSGLNYCVTQFAISVQGNRGLEVIHRSPRNITQEIALVPIKNHVVVGYSPGTISFRDQSGDNWGQIKKLSGQLTGKITVDQDFEFTVICSLR
ncbi:MAG: hypothetical protein AABY64_14770 [Bdellovibrionota bacterium]